MKKVSLDRNRWLLEITEGELNHELLLSVKNLHKLGANPFLYIVPIVPYLLPEELTKGENFVLVDLLKSIPGQAGSSQEPQAEIAQGTLVSFVRANQSP